MEASYILDDYWLHVLDYAIGSFKDMFLLRCVCKWFHIHALLRGNIIDRITTDNYNILCHLLPNMRNLASIHSLGVPVGPIHTRRLTLNCTSCDIAKHTQSLTLKSSNMVLIPGTPKLRIQYHTTRANIDNCTRIKDLCIQWSEISIDFTLMHNLTKLNINTSLDIPYLPNIKKIYATQARIPNLSLMTTLVTLEAHVEYSDLQQLNLKSYTQHHNTAPVTLLTNLRRLSTYVSPDLNLITLTGLRSLSLCGGGYIPSLPQLTRLVVGIYAKTDVKALLTLTNLRSLTMYDNKYVNVDIAAKFTSLTTLKLVSRNHIDNSSFSKLTNLRMLDCTHNKW